VIFVNPFENFVIKILIAEYNNKKYEVSTKYHKVSQSIKYTLELSIT